MSKSAVRHLFTSLVLVSLSGALVAQEWSRFRGPNGSGVGAATGLPVEFGSEQNLVWKAAVPFGRSSPVASSRHIFLTGSEEERLVVVALDRETGKLAWRRTVEPVRDPTMFHENDSSTPSPVTDGRNLYVFLPNAELTAFDPEGGRLWQQDLGDYDSFYGLAASPVLAGDQLIVVSDQVSGSFMASYDRRTGEQRWRQERAGRFESHATPLLYPSTGEPKEVVVYGSGWADGYSLQTGEKLWETNEVAVGPVGSPIISGRIMIVVAPNHGETPFPVWLNFKGRPRHGQGRKGQSS